MADLDFKNCRYEMVSAQGTVMNELFTKRKREKYKVRLRGNRM